ALEEESVSVTTETDASLMKEEIASEKAVGRASYLGGRPESELPSETTDSKGQLKNGWYFKYGNQVTKMLEGGSFPVINGAAMTSMMITPGEPNGAAIYAGISYPLKGSLEVDDITAVPNRTNYIVVKQRESQPGNLILRNNEGTIYESKSSFELKFKSKSKVGISAVVNPDLGGGLMSFRIYSLNLLYTKEWNAIDDLFANQEHTVLADGVKDSDIKQVQGMVDALGVSNEDKVEMNLELDKARPKELATTTLNVLNSLASVATGTAEPNATLTLTVNNVIIGSGTVGFDGKYSVTIPKQTPGTVVKAVAKSGDTTSNEAQVIVSQGGLNPTTLSDVTTDTTTVSGTGEPNGRIELKVGATVIGSGTVGSDGKYSLTIPKQTVGSIVKAIVSKDGLTSEAQKIVSRIGLDPTTLSDITTDTTMVSGTGEPNGRIELKVESLVIGSGTVGSDGKYSLMIPKQTVGSIVEAIVTKDGLTSETKKTVIRVKLVETTLSDITTDTTTVSGTGEPNGRIELKVGSLVIGSGTVGSDGNYSLMIP
ncbi:Ig-like domain-containing protein, partial [Carnobacterium maltaromaticum]|uniref:Ig-like domain-containing protein n=1 Tax=Carnobacterium maltaromaticum TaxID=2751 RepID=UPI001F2A7133